MKMKGEEYTEGTMATFISKTNLILIENVCMPSLFIGLSSLRALVNPVFLKCSFLGS